MGDVWNNVTIYGTLAEIQRFRRECLEPDEQIYRDGQSGWDGCQCTISTPPLQGMKDGRISSEECETVSNFQQFKSRSHVEYSFSFDSQGEFPERLFEQLAANFPNLAFDCACIEASDEFMGYGWFNAPPGGEEFRQDFDVPGDYWNGGGQKRIPEAQAAHDVRVDELKKAALEQTDNTRTSVRHTIQYPTSPWPTIM